LCCAGEGGTTTTGITIDKLPEDVLLEIFGFCQEDFRLDAIWGWLLLAHVCPTWRQVILESPHRLNLQIRCTYGTPVRKDLGIWPGFLIVIDYRYSESGISPTDEDNVIAALEHADRVCHLGVDATGSQLEKMVKLMQEPFPVLTDLSIMAEDGKVPVFPAKFLGKYAPCLQTIFLHGIPVPALPTLLLSTNDLVELRLHKIPPSGYISPEAMVVGLATLPRLEALLIEFQLATPRPDRIDPPPVTRTPLPALTSFQFKGASEYLEDLVSRIDGPRLKGIFIDCFNQIVDFQAAHLSQFIDRSVGAEINPSRPRRIHVTFFSDKVSFTTYHHTYHPCWDQRSVIPTILCKGIDWQVSHMAQMLSYFSATLSSVVHLKLDVQLEEDRQLEGTVDVEWLHLLSQFSTVQTLHVSRELAAYVAQVLEDAITREMVITIELLQSLDLVFLEGQRPSSIRNFVAARRLSDRPVTVVDTKAEFDQRLELFISK
jgi:hypothetical protein